MPLPRADPRPLVDPGAWTAAQATHSVALAQAALAVGQLDMAVAHGGGGADHAICQGMLERLALREVEALSWAAGTPLSAEEIGRDLLQARAGTDVQGLQRARWAVRRLMGEGATTDLRGFLGLHRTAAAGVADPVRLRLTGEHFDEAAAAFRCAFGKLSQAHAFTRAAYARALWPLCDLSPEDDRLESAVWAARTMAAGCEVLPSVPLGHGARQLRGTGPETFGAFLTAIRDGATSARAEVQRLAAWRRTARARSAGIKGANAARIIDVLVAKPLATTEMVAKGADVSRDTAERLLARLHGMGLAREATGTTRFRLWAVRL